MKRVVSFILSVVIIMSCINLVSAATTINFNIALDRESMELRIKGTTDAQRNLTYYVTDYNSEEIRCMEQRKTNEDGSFDINLKLPEDLPYGKYRLVVGGLGNSLSIDDRSRIFTYENLDNFSLWLEAENAELSGNYKKAVNKSESSGGARIEVDTTDTQTKNLAKFRFNIPADDEYEFWVLSTLGNVKYATNYRYCIDNDEMSQNNNEAFQNMYTTNDLRKAPVHWAKLTEKYLTSETHTLTFEANELRQFNDFIYQVLDTVVIVPKEWNWNPCDFHKPYNTSAVKLKCTGTELINDTANRGETAEIYVSAVLEETTSHNVPIWAALVKNGELVSKKEKDMTPSTSKATAGKEYETYLTIQVPSMAPDGEYEILCGIGHAMGKGFNSNASGVPLTNEGFVKVGTISVGDVTVKEPPVAVFESLEIQSEKETVRAEYKLASSTANENQKAFLKFWKDDVLWGVAQTEETAEIKDISSTHIINFEIPKGIPQDIYTVELGFYNVNGTISSSNPIQTELNGKYGYKPLSNGVYTSKKTGKDHFWYVSQENTMIWDGEPYIPIGGMECLNITGGFNGDVKGLEEQWAEDKEELDVLFSKGVTDLYINAMSGAGTTANWIWEYIFDYLEQHGVRYGIQTNGAAIKKSDVYYIRANQNQNGIAVSDITSSGTVTKEIQMNFVDYGKAEAISGCYALIDSNGTVVKTGECKLENNGKMFKFSADIVLPAPGNYTVVFTPKVSQNINIMCNFWDYPDENLEYAYNFGQNVAMGDNFRCIIDPLINESGYYNELESIRPYSAAYNNIYKEYLTNKYSSSKELTQAWGLNRPIDFESASELIPIYTSENTENGYKVYAMNPNSNNIYAADGRKTVMWTDFLDFRDRSTAEFYNKAADAYKENANVPVVVKNVWGHKEYFVNTNESGGIDGLGAEAYGTPERLGNLQTSCFGMGQQFGKTAWLIVTETETEEDVAKKYESHDYGYGTEQNMKDHFDALISYGTKGIFDFLYSARHNDATHTAYSYIKNPEMFEWADNYKKGLDIEKTAKYVPAENKVYMLPYNSNFYTYPNRYTAVHYNDDYNAIIQAEALENMMLMPIENPYTAGEIIAATFQNGPASYNQGRKFGEMITYMPAEKQAVYLGYRKDIGTVPQLDKYFTEEYSLNSDGTRVQILKPTETSEILRTTSDGKPWAIRDGNLWIISAGDAIDDGSVKYLEELNVFMSGTDYVWRDYTITDENGKIPSKLISGELTAKAQVKNNTDKVTNAVLIAAVYSDGVLTGITKCEKQVYPGLNELNVKITVDDEDTMLKTFVWGNMDDMYPINDMKTLKK